MTLKTILTIICTAASFISASAQSNKLNVLVDERIELLTTIQYLSGYPILTQAPLTYKKDIDEWFSDFKDHEAVVLNRNIYRRFFGFDAPPTYLYHFSFPEFRQVAQFSTTDLATFRFDENDDTLRRLLHAFQDFYHKSNFHSFYLAHASFYDSLITPVKNKMNGTGIISILEQHYGQSNKEYNIILAPMLNDGGYGPQITTPNGNILYAIIGPKYDSKEFPEFDIDNLLSEYVIHEFSHSFTNPLITRHLSSLQKDSCLLIPIKEAMKEQGYGSWEGCLMEHMVRANEIVLTEKVYGKEKADELTSHMIHNGKWLYLEGLIPIIRHYQSNRQQYESQEDVMPLVIKYFNDKSKICK